jgi:hypothetical protein
MTRTLCALAALLAFTLLDACAPQGCSTSTDPLTCQNTEGVSNYNRQRQLGARPPTYYYTGTRY